LARFDGQLAGPGPCRRPRQADALALVIGGQTTLNPVVDLIG
jgi:hypothetical protein